MFDLLIIIVLWIFEGLELAVEFVGECLYVGVVATYVSLSDVFATMALSIMTAFIAIVAIIAGMVAIGIVIKLSIGGS